MATNHARLPQRRTIAQRIKADENATSRHVRQSSSIAAAGASRLTAKDANAIKATQTRTALSEVTLTAVNRKDTGNKSIAGKAKEVGVKRGRSDSVAMAQRVPLGPGRAQVAPPVANAVNARVPLVRARVSAISNNRRVLRVVPPPVVVREEAGGEEAQSEAQSEMDIEEDLAMAPQVEDENEENFIGEKEVEAMIGVEDSEEEKLEETAKLTGATPEYIWPDVPADRAVRYQNEVRAIREEFEDQLDMYDTTMVSEYAEEIFEYMCDLEEAIMPSHNYMDGQNEITWSMRQTLVDWLLQVHLRYHMLPETLWIAVNIVDRFLTKRVVSLVKLQLVGVTAMFIAAKYEEILAPSVEEFVFMTENGYNKEEILKGERIVLQTLEFKVSHYCSPYSWMRKISKADDYDIQTRTLSKFLTEVTLLDYRFLRVKPSLVAAVGMYSARRMLGGDWNEAFIFFSGYTEEQLLPGHRMLAEKLVENNFSRQHVCKKYAQKKFLKASSFAIDWAIGHINAEGEEAG